MKTQKTMKKIVTLIVVLALAITALTTGAFAENSRTPGNPPVCARERQATHIATISVENQSDKDVVRFYMSLSSDISWGEDLLRNYYIPAYDGYGMLDHTITYRPDTSFDARFVTRSGEEITITGFTMNGIANPDAVTFVLQGANGEYTIGIF